MTSCKHNNNENSDLIYFLLALLLCAQPVRLELKAALVGGDLELPEGLAAQPTAVLGRDGHVPPDLGEAHGLTPPPPLGDGGGGGGVGGSRCLLLLA